MLDCYTYPMNKLFSKHRKLLIISISMLGVIIFATIGWAMYALRQNSSEQLSKTDGSTTPTSIVDANSAKLAQVSVAANKAINAGDKAAANKVYDDAITTASGSVEKSQLYLGKATNALNTDQPQVALAAAKAAEGLSATSFETLYTLAVIYEQAGDNVLAAQYYRKVAEVAPDISEADPSGNGKQYYIDKALKLEGAS